MTIITKASNCPHCKTLLNGFTAMEEGHEPSEGDMTLCVYCQAPLEFDKDLKLIAATEDALRQVDPKQLATAQKMVKALNDAGKLPPANKETLQ